MLGAPPRLVLVPRPIVPYYNAMTLNARAERMSWDKVHNFIRAATFQIYSHLRTDSESLFAVEKGFSPVDGAEDAAIPAFWFGQDL